MLDVHHLSKTYGATTRGGQPVTALDRVDLHVAAGELVTVLGPSGCGKTTLLRCLAGFETPDSGSITLAGRDVVSPTTRTVPAHERAIGLVPQEGALFPHLSVAQNVGFGLRGMSRRERRTRISETLDLVGLADHGTRRPHQLSGGQQQRIALARAIAPKPAVVLFDEPFSALDEYLRDSLRSEVRELLRSLGTTAVLVTHDQEEALALGDRVVVMRDGFVVQAAHPREAYYRPADLNLARFLGDAVVIDGTVASSTSAPTVTCAFGTLPVAAWHGACGQCNVLIRPENIQVCPLAALQPGGAQPAGTVGTVQSQTFYGHDGLIQVKVPGLDEQIAVRVMGDRPFGIGDQVHLTVDSAVCTYAS